MSFLRQKRLKLPLFASVFIFYCIFFRANLHAANVEMDVPFIVSAPAVTKAMLDIAKVMRDDRVLDLGAGDGRIIITAAKQYGARGVGVEIDPKLVALARANAITANVSNLVVFRTEDLFKADLSRATVITMYLLPDVNLALREKLLALQPGTRIVSHDWDMGDWLPDDTRVVDNPDKAIGLEKISRVHLWIIPARLAGLWCAETPAREDTPATTVSLQLSQQYQKLDGVLRARVSSSPANAAAKPLIVRFRATLQGGKFAIAHPAGDAVGAASAETIQLDGRPYGLRANLRFTRADSCLSGAKPIRTAQF